MNRNVCTRLFPFLFVLFCSTALWAAGPTLPAKNLTFSSLDGGSLRLNFTRGDGARRIVIARQSAPVTAVPANGTDYLHHSTFGSGQAIAEEEFVVYDGTSDIADVYGLLPATTYHFTIYEYNGTASATEYAATGASAAQATLSAPATPASAITFSEVTGNALTISWTNGSGSKRLVLMREGSPVNANPADLSLYSPNSTFGAGIEIGAGNYVVAAGPSNSIKVGNLQPGRTYHVAVYEAAGVNTPVYRTAGAPTASRTTEPRPTQAASAITFTDMDGASFRLNFIKGNGSRRIIIARAGSPVDAIPADGTDYLAGTTASLATAPEIAPGQKVIFDHFGDLIDLTSVATNTTYHFRIFEYDGSGSTIAYQTAQSATASINSLSTPTTAASAITFSEITSSSMTLSWTKGNGSRRIVVARAGGPVTAQPADLVNYPANNVWTSGTQLGSGNYVIYSGNGNSTPLYGLLPNVVYHFAVFEANGINAPLYLTGGAPTASQATAGKPSVPAKNITLSHVQGNSLRLNWTRGNGTHRIVVVRAGQPVDALPADGTDYLNAISAPFTSAPEIAPGQKVIYDNLGDFADVTGLTPGLTYHFRVYEYTLGSLGYLTDGAPEVSATTLSAPATPASALSFSNVTGNGMTVQWVNGSGTRRLVIARAGAPVNAQPADLIQYSGSSVFGNGTHLGNGNYVVYNGIGSTNLVALTNLEINTTYHFAVFEGNGTDGPVYLTAGAPAASQATQSRPTQAPGHPAFSHIQGNSMRLTWTRGNGTRRIVIARAGAPVDAVPVDGTDYLASSFAPFATAPEIAPGQKVVYDNIGDLLDLTGLNPATVYHFRIYEYSGSGSTSAYLTATFGSGSQSTQTTPTQAASNLSFSSVGSTSVAVNWTAGNGSHHLLVARKGGAVNADPADLTAYNASNQFGLGTQIGTGNFVVAKITESNAAISGLQPGTTYHFTVYELNGTDAPLYLRPGTSGQVTTIGPPSVQATAATAKQYTGTSVQLGWTNGSGNRRIVLMKKDAPVDAVPVNDAAYFANSFFGTGTQIGNGNYVVFDGIQDFVTITALQPQTNYHFAVFEYNRFGTATQVLTLNPATGNLAGLLLPVTFLRFTGAPAAGGIQLQWATATEEQSDRFEVERSADGRSFTQIGSVQAAGSSNLRNDYAFTDNSPLAGTQHYRLKQVDTDGTFSYSSTVTVRYGGTTALQVVSPARQQLAIRLS
ncbi:MAG TPA: hypothetical protein VHK69_18055, partial [Chitinophagaceae bacterium]|nr:hypothetical protein [Chitinophagaceae bacterium]